MVATRSRVGTPQAFISLPYLCLDYLLCCHPNKPMTCDSSLCALLVGELIPKPFRFRERDPLPAIRPCPHTPVTIPNEYPPVERRSWLAFEQASSARHYAPAVVLPPHARASNTCLPSSVISHTCCSTPARDRRVSPVGAIYPACRSSLQRFQ